MTVNVLIVDDSFFVRKQLADIIERSDGLTVLDRAEDGREALDILNARASSIDVMLLDIEMPRLNGLDTLKKMRDAGYSIPVLVVSSLTTDGARETSLALRRGAADVIAKPSRSKSNLDEIERELTETILEIGRSSSSGSSVDSASRQARSSAPDSASDGSVPSKLDRLDPKVLLIGGSTGAPPLLRSIVEQLPAHFPIPVVIVQHISEPFLSGLCETLDELTSLEVRQVNHGMQLKQGCVYLPADEKHLDFRSGADARYIRPQEGDPVSGAIPSVDQLFDNARNVLGPETINVLLTGMGEDGARAMKRARDEGALCMAQDRESSTVYGMPGKAEELDAVDKLVSGAEIPKLIVDWVANGDDPDHVSKNSRAST